MYANTIFPAPLTELIYILEVFFFSFFFGLRINFQKFLKNFHSDISARPSLHLQIWCILYIRLLYIDWWGFRYCRQKLSTSVLLKAWRWRGLTFPLFWGSCWLVLVGPFLLNGIVYDFIQANVNRSKSLTLHFILKKMVGNLCRNLHMYHDERYTIKYWQKLLMFDWTLIRLHWNGYILAPHEAHWSFMFLIAMTAVPSFSPSQNLLAACTIAEKISLT